MRIDRTQAESWQKEDKGMRIDRMQAKSWQKKAGRGRVDRKRKRSWQKGVDYWVEDKGKSGYYAYICTISWARGREERVAHAKEGARGHRSRMGAGPGRQKKAFGARPRLAPDTFWSQGGGGMRWPHQIAQAHPLKQPPNHTRPNTPFPLSTNLIK